MTTLKRCKKPTTLPAPVSKSSSVNLRLKHRNILEDLVNAAAWLANDLVDVLLKVASNDEPHPAMASDPSRRIREAEVRLELLREMNRQ